MKKYLIQPEQSTIQLTEQKVVKLAEYDVRVKVMSSSLNYRDIIYKKINPVAVTALSDGAGEIIEIGSKVQDLKVGDRVTGLFFPEWLDCDEHLGANEPARGGDNVDGMLATEVVGNAKGFIKFPDYLSYEEAATLPCAGLTAWHAMFEHPKALQAGQTVLIQGTGGVSIFALQLANAFGIHSIVTSSSDDKLKIAKSMGATHTINYRETPNWGQKVLELTDGKGVDMVIEVGGAGTLEQSMNAVKIRGVISLIGVLTGFDEKVNTVPITVKMISMFGIHVGSKAMYSRFNQALSQHKIKPIIDKVFDFSEAKNAYDYLESSQHLGKVVIKH